MSEDCFLGPGSGKWQLWLGDGVIVEVLPPSIAEVFTRRSLKQVPDVSLIKVDKVGCQAHVDCFARALFPSNLILV